MAKIDITLEGHFKTVDTFFTKKILTFTIFTERILQQLVDNTSKAELVFFLSIAVFSNQQLKFTDLKLK